MNNKQHREILAMAWRIAQMSRAPTEGGIIFEDRLTFEPKSLLDFVERTAKLLNAPVEGQKLDPVVEANRALMHERSQVGIKKYGVTLGDAKLSRRELMTHALQEALDLANYIQADLMREDGAMSHADMLAQLRAERDASEQPRRGLYNRVCDALDVLISQGGVARVTRGSAFGVPGRIEWSEAKPNAIHRSIPDSYDDYCAAVNKARPCHQDDFAVDATAAAMKARMAECRAEGKFGWNDPLLCPTKLLQKRLVEAVADGNPVDVANYAMMLHRRQARTELVMSAAVLEALCLEMKKPTDNDIVALAIRHECYPAMFDSLPKSSEMRDRVLAFGKSVRDFWKKAPDA